MKSVFSSEVVEVTNEHSAVRVSNYLRITKWVIWKNQFSQKNTSQTKNQHNLLRRNQGSVSKMKK